MSETIPEDVREMAAQSGVSGALEMIANAIDKAEAHVAYRLRDVIQACDRIAAAIRSAKP